MSREIRVGSRGSALAVRQAEIVMAAIRKADPGLCPKLITIATAGDKTSAPLQNIGGKGLFVREVEAALVAREIDIAVHSYKDMPVEESPDLPIVALSPRTAPFDVLVLPAGCDRLIPGKPIGTASRRRAIQWESLCPRFPVTPLRGNVPTRLAKLDAGGYAGIIVAEAGLRRLSLEGRISHVFTAREMIPAASQGIIAVQGRTGEDYAYLAGFHSRASETISLAERAFLRALNADCSAPVAAYGEIQNGALRLTGLYANTYGRSVTDEISGETADARRLGETLATQRLERLAETCE